MNNNTEPIDQNTTVRKTKNTGWKIGSLVFFIAAILFFSIPGVSQVMSFAMLTIAIASLFFALKK